MLEEKHLPVYGKGENIRDWLYVEDHCRAIWKIISFRRVGETYNIGGENELKNIDLTNILCEMMAITQNKGKNYYKKFITFVKDRPGHDFRYAINMTKIKNELSFNLSVDFNEGINKTIKWYLNNLEWLNNVKSGKYRNWIKKNYEDR